MGRIGMSFLRWTCGVLVVAWVSVVVREARKGMKRGI